MELKACPFCGSDDVTVRSMRGRRGWFVFCCCEFCGSQGKTFTHKSDQFSQSDGSDFWDDESIVQAKKAWNMRARCSNA